ncbi:uncharacterized protein L201_005520 [Kwoniella dendrophila CBS 6074]|uniref:Uncharacterized protein n=1 Tax=Kwoniella dendrophila CBS 6074 TaxID=1295534 RepID=A0AAX4JZG1_9TREE
MTSLSPVENKISPTTTQERGQFILARRSTTAPNSPLLSPNSKIATPNTVVQAQTAHREIAGKPIPKRKTLPLPPDNVGNGIPINAASVIMGLGRGNGIPANNHPHAITPGNTLNSLEQITNRIANNLGGSGFLDDQAENKIAPSYERRFHAGLGDLNRRLSSPGAMLSRSSSPMIAPTASSSVMYGDHVNNNPRMKDWPSSFSALDASTHSIRSNRDILARISSKDPSEEDESK